MSIGSVDRRTLLAGAVALGGVGPSPVEASGEPTAPFDAAVGAEAAGVRRYATLAAAIEAAPERGAGRPWRILVGTATLTERLVVARPDIHLIGQSAETSILTASAAAGDPGLDGKPLGTFGCATLIVRAPGFSARRLTIANGFDYPAALNGARYERTGPNGAQAVALMLDKGADRSLFEQVSVVGHQDTLFVDQGRSLFRDCRVSGSVDFIFGGGQALFERCRIVSRARPGLQRNQGFVTAPSTPRSRRFGLVFTDCALTREPGVPPASVVLGRPWRPGRAFADGHYGDPEALGAAAFIRCAMDDHISADGWDEMGYQARDGSRAFLEPGEARFAEFASTGPGAFHNRRRRWMTLSEAKRFTPEAVLDGWKPI